MATVQAHIIVTGRVQGVFFRESTRQEAEKHGVVGWIKNLPDGTVEALFQGEPPAVQALVQYCHSGPRAANVESVIVEQRDENDHTLASFLVLRR